MSGKPGATLQQKEREMEKKILSLSRIHLRIVAKVAATQTKIKFAANNFGERNFAMNAWINNNFSKTYR